MKISSIGVVIGPVRLKPGSKKFKTEAADALDRVYDNIGEEDGFPLGTPYLTPIRHPQNIETNKMITDGYAIGIKFDSVSDLTPQLVSDYIIAVSEIIGKKLRIDNEFSGDVLSRDTKIPLWSFFPDNVIIGNNTVDSQSVVSIEIMLEGMAHTPEQKEALHAIVDDARFPSYNPEIHNADFKGGIPTWLETEGHGDLELYNPAYGDKGPVIVLRKEFVGDMDADMERRIELFYNEVKNVSYVHVIQSRYLNLAVASKRVEWLRERGVNMAQETFNATAFANGIYGPKMSVEYTMRRPEGSIILNSVG